MLKSPIRGSMCFYDKKHEVILFSVLSHNSGEKSFWMVSRPLSWISTAASLTPVSHSPCFCASLEAVLGIFPLPFCFSSLHVFPLPCSFFFQESDMVQPGSVYPPLLHLHPSLSHRAVGSGMEGGGWVGVGRMKKWASPVNHASVWRWHTLNNQLHKTKNM